MKRRFFRYVLQSTLGMIGLSVYILADTFFISVSSGADGITVLNMVLPLYGLIYAIGAMIGIGSATRFSIAREQGQKADTYFFQSLVWQIIWSIPFVAAGIAGPERYLQIMGADTQIAALGQGYTRIVLLGAPFFMTHYTFTAFARNDKAPAKAMLASLSGSCFNIVFDYIFMFPMGMGLKGAALATILSPAVTSLVTMTHFLSRSNTIRLQASRLSLRTLIDVCQLGFSGFVGEMTSAVTTTVYNFLLLRVAGNLGVAAYGVTANLALVAMCIFNGIAQGTQPLFSTAYGKGSREELKEILHLGLITAAAAQILINGIAWGFTDGLVQIFNSENNRLLARYAHTGLRLYFLGYLLAGINILLVNYYAAIEKVKKAFVLSFLRGMAGITLSAVLLAAVAGMNGIWLSFLVSEGITLLVVLIMKYMETDKKTKN